MNHNMQNKNIDTCWQHKLEQKSTQIKVTKINKNNFVDHISDVNKYIK